MRHDRTSVLLAACVITFTSATILIEQSAWPQLALATDAVDDDGQRPTIAPALAPVTASVVNISVTSSRPVAQNPLFNDPFFRRFFELPEEPAQRVPQQSAGSGVIVDAGRGYVLTNHHVIENAEEILVTLTDRRRFDAELIGSDPGTDVAVLQIEADGLTAIKLADSDTLKVGDLVVAIGNPFGVGQTVTSGIVSALGRTGLNIEDYESFIQTDASINPGNSGGALIDLEGALVGINTAILSASGGNIGIGFAVPVNIARAVMNQVLEYGEVRRGRLGVFIQSVTPDLAEALGLDVQEGAVVTQVEPGSSAAKAGLEVGDVVVEFNGDPVNSGADLRTKVGLAAVGTTVTLGVVRDGGRRELRAVVEEGAGSSGGSEAIERLQGVELRNLAPGDPGYGSVRGVLVAAVAAGSRGARSGLQPGDVVTAVNRRPVDSVADLRAALEAAPDAVALSVARGDQRLFIVVR
jgi:serine protease DegQ